MQLLPALAGQEDTLPNVGVHDLRQREGEGIVIAGEPHLNLIAKLEPHHVQQLAADGKARLWQGLRRVVLTVAQEGLIFFHDGQYHGAAGTVHPQTDGLFHDALDLFRV